MKRVLLIAALLALGACGDKTPEATSDAGAGYTVDRLFTYDSCTVYRFRDGGSRRYFTRCEGAASTSTSWAASCGKNCTRTVEVPGAQP